MDGKICFSAISDMYISKCGFVYTLRVCPFETVRSGRQVDGTIIMAVAGPGAYATSMVLGRYIASAKKVLTKTWRGWDGRTSILPIWQT